MKRLELMLGLVAAASLVSLGAAAPPAPEAPTMIFDLDTAVYKAGTCKDAAGKDVSCGRVELVEGKFGKAAKFTFTDGRGFMSAKAKPYIDWDQSDGFSFWVKGDGSKSWAGIQLIDGSDGDFKRRYAYCFSIESTKWEKVTVPWRDLVPELPEGPLIDAKAGLPPSSLNNYWFGKRWYWGEFPPCSFTVDQIQVERKISMDRSLHIPATAGTPRTLAKLKTKQPVTIVTMGDSLSDKKHKTNREKLWSELLEKSIEEKYGSKVTLVNPAMGGTQMAHSLVLMPRWLKDTPKPDVVTVWFGAEDYGAGVRAERFKEMLRFAVDRIRRETKGASEVVLITPPPTKTLWTEMDALAQAARDVAKEKKTGLADVAAEFHKPASADEAQKSGYWADDGVTLGSKGHDVARDCVLDAIENGK